MGKLIEEQSESPHGNWEGSLQRNSRPRTLARSGNFTHHELTAFPTSLG